MNFVRTAQFPAGEQPKSSAIRWALERLGAPWRAAAAYSVENCFVRGQRGVGFTDSGHINCCGKLNDFTRNGLCHGKLAKFV